MTNKDEQLKAWQGEFGDEYIDRNSLDEKTIQQRIAFMSSLMSTLPSISYFGEPKSILEVGANVGANLKALDEVYRVREKQIELHAVEPNLKARKILLNQDIRGLKIVDGHACSIEAEKARYDVVFTCGVLIHIHPDNLQIAMGEIYRVSRKFIMCAEYFSDQPREIPYQGKSGMLWARDFGEAWLNGFPGLRCCGYSFAWKRFTGMDNLNWWTFEKVN